MLWLRKLEYDYMSHAQQSKVHAPTMIWNDPNTCIKWLRNHCLHSKTKHIETPVLSIRDELIRFKSLDVDYVPTTQQLADNLTKIQTPKTHWSLARHVLGGRIPHEWFHNTAVSEGGYHEAPKAQTPRPQKGGSASQDFG